nr:hypothetical protein [Tanacetum cinerariifolium]
MVEEVTSLKKDFKQKENKYLEEFLDIKALEKKVEDKLFKQDQSLQTVHVLFKPKPYYDEQRKLVLLVYKVAVVFNKVNATKSRVTTDVRVSTAGWIKWLEEQDMQVKKLKIYSLGSTSGVRAYEEKLDRKNEMKARGTLLMALLNKDQLKFHSYQDAKLLMEAIKKRYGGNKESKKVHMILLKQQYKNFAALSSETLDQTFDRAPKTQENKGREYGRKTMPVENLTKNSLIGQDGTGGYDWSYQAEEENLTNFALMALTSSGSSSTSDFEVDSCSKTCLKAYATLKEQYDSLSLDYKKSQFNLLSYKAGNYIPSKPDRMFIDKQVESESVDVVSTVSSSDVKTVESKVESVDVKNKGVCNTVKTKPVKKKNFSPSIIEDYISDDESEVEFKPKVEDRNVRPSIEKIKFVKTARETKEKVETLKQHKHNPRGNQRNWNNLMSQRL